VLLLLLLMAALASALAVGGHTETLVARNHQAVAQARAAAEAGLNHAAEVVIAWILAWKSKGYTDVDTALDSLLTGVAGNPAFVADVTFGDAGGPTAIAGTTDAKYHVFLMDEDDAAQRAGAATDLGGDEGGGATDDRNKTLVIQSVGYGPSNASVRLEAIISPYKLPAVASDGDLTLSGTATTIYVGADANGGVHANGDLTFSGAAAIVGLPDVTKGTATASGECDSCALPTVVTNPADSGEHKPMLEIPEIRASDFRNWADRILIPNGSTGQITDASGTVLCTTGNSGNECQSAYGWGYNKNTGEWDLATTAANDFTYYVEGPVVITGGSVTSPLVATVIAEGSITGSGNGYIRPDTADLLFVTDVDLVLSGGFQAGASLAEGQMLVREQIAISGTAALFGQLVIQDATSTATPHTSSISGSVVVTNNQDVGSSMFRVAGWREVR
jgi:hypothetical protein